ncbi:MAG: metal-dependent transcriptional regulator [Clostridiales bacterium]|jgi:Mn-dependent DtxR family transcriptional regulator|nr:metal-dependent transcriptional regulator [Clostridiales bacterium]
MDKLSFTMENYLEAVYELSREGHGARLTDIAAQMSVTKSTANTAMAALAEKGLVEGGRYRQIVLTDTGLAMASGVAQKHKTIQQFFTEILNIDDETADTDACAIEHVISDKAVEAMRGLLNGQLSRNGAKNGDGDQ